MAACPRCQRPLALARPQCLYCGAALDADLVPAPVPAAVEGGPAPPNEERALVVMDAAGADTAVVAQALGLSRLEAAQRIHRGWLLHRITSPAEAAVETSRLRGLGLKAQTLAEVEIRPALQPRVAEGGRRTGDGVELRIEGAIGLVRPADVLVIVSGAIHRERQSVITPRRGHLTRSLLPGHRFHVHQRGDASPTEIDPEAFAFDEPRHPPTSSWLSLQEWLAALAAPGPLDEGFRFLPPALGVAEPPGRGDLARALVESPSRRDRGGPATLDNLAQFRFYSGWRAAALRAAKG